MDRHVKDLLPRVRKILLEERVRMGDERSGFGLSWLTWQLGPVRSSPSEPLRSRFTSGASKKIRGHVQACLSILAREGLVFGRNRPEAHVAPYEHGETDKRFRIRITAAAAQKQLSRMT